MHSKCQAVVRSLPSRPVSVVIFPLNVKLMLPPPTPPTPHPLPRQGGLEGTEGLFALPERGDTLAGS